MGLLALNDRPLQSVTRELADFWWFLMRITSLIVRWAIT